MDMPGRSTKATLGWDKGKFESTVSETMQNADEVKSLSNNRTAYWNSKENMVVMKIPPTLTAARLFGLQMVKRILMG